MCNSAGVTLPADREFQDAEECSPFCEIAIHYLFNLIKQTAWCRRVQRLDAGRMLSQESPDTLSQTKRSLLSLSLSGTSPNFMIKINKINSPNS